MSDKKLIITSGLFGIFLLFFIFGCKKETGNFIKKETKYSSQVEKREEDTGVLNKVNLNGIIRQSSSTNWLEAEGSDIVDASTHKAVYLRGLNLGYWLNQEGYMMNPQGCENCPQTQWQMKKQYYDEGKSIAEIDDFYQNWRNNFITKADIDYIASLGFNCIRLPLSFNLFFNSSQLSVLDQVIYASNPAERGNKHDLFKDKLQLWYNNNELFNNSNLPGFKLIDDIIRWCADNDIYVILDLHVAPGGQGSDASIANLFYANNLWGYHGSPEHTIFQDVTNMLWKKISLRYMTEPCIVFYDLINEPNNVPGGGQTIHSLYQRLITTIRNNGDNHMIMLEGNGWGNNYDYLEPFTFSPNWGLVYNAHRYGISPSDDYISDPNPNQINRLVNLLNFRNTYNVPVFVGETGENSDSWLAQNIQKLEDNNIPWAFWTYKRHDVYEDAAIMRIGGSYPTDGASVMNNVLNSIKFDNCIPNSNTISAVTGAMENHNSVPYGKTIWLKGNNGKYVSSEDGQQPMTCNRDIAQSWEHFKVIDKGDGKIALKSMGKFISSENGVQSITCNRSTAQGWEEFQWITTNDGKVELKGNNGKFISSENGQQPMTCNRSNPSGWEAFNWGIVQ